MKSQFYVIYRTAPGAGFWSNFACVLQGLDYAEKNGLVPVVDMERHKTLYSESEPIEGSLNAWEYYFEQPGGVSLTEALAGRYEHTSGRATGEFVSVFAVEPPRHLVERARSLIAKYIRPKKSILDAANAVIPSGVHANILGVHVRGTELRKNISPRHPIPDLAMAYLERAKLLDNTHHFQNIFLATDEEESLGMFKTAFGDRLRYLDVHRTPPTAQIAVDYKWLFAVDRHHHRYQLGREVLLDAMLLARCGHFIGGISNVSHATSYLSDSSQIVHPMTPLWVTPKSDGTSLGLKYLQDVELPKAMDPVGVLLAQKRELYQLLAETETRAAAMRQELKRAERSLVPLSITKLARRLRGKDKRKLG